MLISTVQRWDAGAVQASALRLAWVSGDLWRVRADLTGVVADAVFRESKWQGSASDAAQQALQQRVNGLALLAGALDAAQAATAAFAAAVANAHTALAAALSPASPNFLVADDGSVSLAPYAVLPDSGPSPTPELPSPSPEPADGLASQLGSISTSIAAALADADAADNRCASALQDVQGMVDSYLRTHAQRSLLAAEQQSMSPLELLTWLTTVPPAGTSAADVATWWASHDDNARAQFLAAHPDQIGNLDGVPPGDRDTANRLALAQHITQLEYQIANPGSMNAGGALDAQLSWYLAVQRQLTAHASDRDERSQGGVPIQLLILDQSAFGGTGRAALAFGDVGTATDVTYVVPGLNQTVNPEFGRTVSNAWNMYERTGHLDPSRSGAVIAWMGYQTPGWFTVETLGKAEAGAARLRDDIAGLHAVRGDNQPHLTVVGHSYGSTTAALAASRYHLGIDELILVGSPGATVTASSQLHVPPGHVWDGAASGDVVSWMRWFGNVDPSTAEFGGTRFEAETVSRSGATDGTHNMGEHSHYFDKGSESLANISRVIINDDRDVVTAPYRENNLTVSAYGGYYQSTGANDDPELRRPVTITP